MQRGMDNNFNSDMDMGSTSLAAVTVVAYILGAITLSSIATGVAIFAGITTIIYNVVRIVQTIRGKADGTNI